MRLLADWDIVHRGKTRRIELYWGDLSYLPPGQEVDILVVSAFPEDYIPTPSSLIGALYRNGISVEKLSFAKERDMRKDLSCWLSEPLVGVRSFRRILCIESGWRGTPPEIADDVFRAIAPFSVSEFPNGSMAMPLIGAGDQAYPAGQVFESILRAAVSWFRRGLPISVLKIVAYSDRDAAMARSILTDLKRADAEAARKDPQGRGDTVVRGTRAFASGYDIFLSYCHKDMEPAQRICQLLESYRPGIRVFFDRRAVVPGESWLMRIAESLDTARRVAALFTPDYWQSSYCKDEFCAAYTRQADTGAPILWPIYFRDTTIPYLFKTTQYKDCREADVSKLPAACRELSVSVA